MAANSGEKLSTRPRAGRGTKARVRRRRLLYVGGFDPASAKKQYAIFTAEAPRQAALDGAVIEAGPLQDRDDLASGWTVTARWAGESVNTDYVILRWHDIVRQVWPKDDPRLFWGAWTSLFDYARAGILTVALRDSPVVFITAVTPVLLSSAFVLAYAAILAAAFLGAARVVGSVGWPIWTAVAAPLILLPPFFLVWRWADRFINVAWLARGMICMVRAGRGAYPEIDDRCEAFARKLIEADQAGDADEILVVGHSMGAQLACQAMGMALAADPQLGRRKARVNLLTLGQLIPFYSLQTRGPAFAEDMMRLVEARHVGWVDYTSPADPGSAANLHPLEGVMTDPPEDRPVRRSPRFHKLLTRATYRALKRRPLEFHFAYLKAMEARGDYDVFALTCGPDFLAGAA